MSSSLERKVVLVTRRTRLEDLLARHHTAAQAKFYVEHLGADFTDYQREHDAYLEARRATLEVLQAQRQLFPAENALAQIRFERLATLVALYRALGGGWNLDQPAADEIAPQQVSSR